MPFDVLNSSLTKIKCPSCGALIEWSITTHFDKEKNSEVCTVCKAVLNKR